MALIVETGEGVTGANSFTSLVDAQAFIDARELSTTLTEGILLQSMDHLNAVDLKPEVTAWPTVVADGLVAAQIWGAYYIAQGNDLLARSTPSVKREKVDVLEVEYATREGQVESVSFLSLPNVRNSLKGLINSTRGIARH